jgi:SAM-dependent methyltransferase
VSNDIFGSYARYYNLLYRDKDYAGEVEYIVQTLRAAARTAQTVLEFGSGTGRHGRLLAERGFKILGVEGSETMAVAAKTASQNFCSTKEGSFDCVHGDIRVANLEAKFDAVLSLFHVVSYQTSNKDLLDTFGNAARHLDEGGVFFFDVWHGPAVLAERPSVRVKRVEDESTYLTRIAEPELDTNRSIVTVRYTMLAQSKADGTLTNFAEEHHMRYLFATEIDLLARQTGFTVERSEEFMTGRPASDSTWGVAYLLRKQA